MGLKSLTCIALVATARHGPSRLIGRRLNA
jgi:hypothetical protein